jgi:uncharacterized protein (DUF58 family)
LKAELARLNHILIPTTKSGRDRYRNSRVGRRLRPLRWVSSRLSFEGRVLFAVTLLAALFSANPGRTQSHVLVLATASLLLAALAFTRAYRLKGVSAELGVPRRVMLGDEISIRIELRNGSAVPQRALRVEPPLLPWDGAFITTPGDIECLEAHGRASTLARARFTARGVHELDSFRVAALLPLGLSQGPSVTTAGARFLVVPRVARVRSLELPERRRHQPGGIARAARTGDATELIGVRQYRPGDPLRDLHARSWARHGTPMVREYQEEHFMRVGVVIDTAPTGNGAAALEAALSLAAGTIARLCRSEALVELLVTAEHDVELGSGRGPASLDQALDVLALVQSSAHFDAQRLLQRVAVHLERLSALVVVALAWDQPRRAFVSEVRARGVNPIVLVVGAPGEDGAEPTASVRWVSPDAIINGQELVL